VKLYKNIVGLTFATVCCGEIVSVVAPITLAWIIATAFPTVVNIAFCTQRIRVYDIVYQDISPL